MPSRDRVTSPAARFSGLAMTTLRSTGALGSDLSQAETAHDDPMMGSGPTIRINQRSSVTVARREL
jgi:hypothetical protein